MSANEMGVIGVIVGAIDSLDRLDQLMACRKTQPENNNHRRGLHDLQKRCFLTVSKPCRYPFTRLTNGKSAFFKQGIE